MPNLLLVMLGGAFGAGARYGAQGLLPAPWGTFAVNVVGGLLMGALVGLLARFSAGGEQARLLLGVGVLGGFTTFSSFSLDSWLLAQRGEWMTFGAYVGGSVVLSILALGAGLWLARA